LQISHWAAWAPGLNTHADWQAWLQAPRPLDATETAPPLPEVPAMARRRIDPLGRIALQVAYWAQQDLTPEQVAGMPLVFASRWGELARSLALLQDLAAAQPLSPTAFSHSVHNAIGALYSIQRGVRANCSAVAAGAYSAEAGWTEALGLIATGTEEVLLVVFDAPLPPPYFGNGLDAPLAPPHAYALRLRAAAGPGLRLDTVAAHQPPPADLPASLAALRFCVGADPALHQGPWHWSRA
jgi:hypothetical protein